MIPGVWWILFIYAMVLLRPADFLFSEFPYHLCKSEVDLLGAGLTRRKTSTVSVIA
jgi:hypothetical protein